MIYVVKYDNGAEYSEESKEFSYKAYMSLEKAEQVQKELEKDPSILCELLDDYMWGDPEDISIWIEKVELGD